MRAISRNFRQSDTFFSQNSQFCEFVVSLFFENNLTTSTSEIHRIRALAQKFSHAPVEVAFSS